MSIFHMTTFEWVYVIIFVIILVGAVIFIKKEGEKIMQERDSKK